MAHGKRYIEIGYKSVDVVIALCNSLKGAVKEASPDDIFKIFIVCSNEMRHKPHVKERY